MNAALILSCAITMAIGATVLLASCVWSVSGWADRLPVDRVRTLSWAGAILGLFLFWIGAVGTASALA